MSVNEEDDERVQEVQVLESIYPEMRVDEGGVSGSVEVAVAPPCGVAVFFECEMEQREYKISHLPPIELIFDLPRGYPGEKPPRVRLEALWMDRQRLEELKEELMGLFDHEQVIFSMVDLLQQKVETEFCKLTFTDPAMKDVLFQHDLQANQREFENRTFHCAICQSRKKGAVCVRLANCGDVFCTECLTDYFTACIDQGYINQVVCPQPDCTSPGLNKQELTRLVGEARYDRWETLKKKQEIEADPNTAVICPRNFCQALIKRNPDDNLTICGSCEFAFCAVCKRSWHGYFDACRIPEPSKEIIEEYMEGDELTRAKIEASWGKNNMKHHVHEYECEKGFREYMELHDNRECPKCQAPIERSMGCNKMTCPICSTFFCFLCAQELDRQNPYDHYGNPMSQCYRRLFQHTEIEDFDDPAFRGNLIPFF